MLATLARTIELAVKFCGRVGKYKPAQTYNKHKNTKTNQKLENHKIEQNAKQK